MSSSFYPIGTPGRPWSEADTQAWLAHQSVKRSYQDDVVSLLSKLDSSLVIEPYGALSHNPDRYPLLAAKPRHPRDDRPWMLITGGVHGYESSGVHGALQFLLQHASSYNHLLNMLIVPCVSPWGYEVVHRWNPQARDPNRSFGSAVPTEESAALKQLVARTANDYLIHVDLHETTNSDETEFRPALAARDGTAFTPGTIPDGFYTVADVDNPQLPFQEDIVSAVKKITHIAPADNNDQIIGLDVVRPGVIVYPVRKLGLCASVTRAKLTTTTEVYPDSPLVTPQLCNAVQVTTIRAAISHVM